jgi:Flp pilus assembly protein TadB
MEAAFIVFLLLFAILAFAWFYLQRAKRRDATTTTVDHQETDTAARPVDRPE